MGTTRKNKKSKKLDEATNQPQVISIKKLSKRKHENLPLKSTEVKEISKKKKDTTVIEQAQKILTKKSNAPDESKKGVSVAEEINEAAKQPQETSKKKRSKRKRENGSLKSTEAEEVNEISTKKEDTTKIEHSQEIQSKRLKKKKSKDPNESEKGVSFAADVVDNEVEASETPKKRKKVNDDSQLPTEEELAQINKPENVKNVVSNRAKKREKYENLLKEKEVQSTIVSQQKALNYLSRWKHNKSEWKFEKLRQIWLLNHMFDSASVPDEFWDDVLAYFGEAQGRIRKLLLENCMKIIDVEKEEKTSDEEIKYTRARALCQHLQE